MSNNYLQPYAADVCARLYKTKKGKPFSIEDLPHDVKKAALKNNQIIERVQGKEYKFTQRGINVMKRRGLI